MANANNKKTSTKNKKVVKKAKTSPSKEVTKKQINKNEKSKLQKLSKKNIIMLLLTTIFLLVLIIGATYAYYNVTSNNNNSTQRLLTEIPKVGNVSLVNNVKNLHIRMNALNMQQGNITKELWATDTEADYEEEETPREVAKATVVGGEESTRYTCTFDLNINVTGSMVSSLQEGDAIIRFSGLDNFEYDLTDITSPRRITINTLSGKNREEILYVSAKINNKIVSQDYLQGKELNIDITNSNFTCDIKTLPSDSSQ